MCGILEPVSSAMKSLVSPNKHGTYLVLRKELKKVQ